MPTGLRDKLPTSGSRRLHDAALRELIQELCGWQPLTARELTALLQRRNAKYLVRKTLSPMLAAGLLAYTIPQMENHPEQRYTLTAAQTDDE